MSYSAAHNLLLGAVAGTERPEGEHSDTEHLSVEIPSDLMELPDVHSANSTPGLSPAGRSVTSLGNESRWGAPTTRIPASVISLGWLLSSLALEVKLKGVVSLTARRPPTSRLWMPFCPETHASSRDTHSSSKLRIPCNLQT